MVKKIVIASMFVLLILSCKDQQLALRRQSYQNEALPLNIGGFYWSKVIGWNDEKWFDIYFFYRSGHILYSGGVENLDEFPERTSDLLTTNWGVNLASEKNYKTQWGVFKINSSEIQFEKWEPSSGGPMKTVIRQGDILNDTTFVIRKRLNNYDGKTYLVQDTFRFRQFSPKPDSTNNFIK